MMSTFYLDIIKDRLYCEAADSLGRRSAQTVLYLTLGAMAKLFAPILAFTCNEIWLAMPHRSTDDPRNILLNEMDKPFTAYHLDADRMETWRSAIALRQDVNGILELARADKRIGKALEAQVTLKADDSQAEAVLKAVEGMNLKDLFIVSAVDFGEAPADAVTGRGGNFPGLQVSVSNAPGTKCPRCWMHTTEPGEDGLCPRCAAVVAAIDPAALEL